MAVRRARSSLPLAIPLVPLAVPLSLSALLGASVVPACSSDSNDPAAADASPSDAQEPADVMTDASDAGASDSDAPKDAPFETAAHEPFPVIGKGDGGILTDETLVVIIPSNEPLASDIFAYADRLVVSDWWKTAGAEYGVLPPTHPPIHLTGEPITSAKISSLELEKYIQRSIAPKGASDAGGSGADAGAGPGVNAAPNGHSFYYVILPEGTIYGDPNFGDNTDCSLFGAFHNSFYYVNIAPNDSWGMGQRCPTSTSGLSALQGIESSLSHEAFEAATDPMGGTGWGVQPAKPVWKGSAWATVAGYGELADFCSFAWWIEGGDLYERTWSNAAARSGGDPCVPAVHRPYANVSTPAWTAVKPGASATIDVTGWTSEPTDPFFVEAVTWQPTEAGWTIDLESPLRRSVAGRTVMLLQNGVKATLTVSAPSAAKHGSYTQIEIYSLDQNQGRNEFHTWLAGAYVP